MYVQSFLRMSDPVDWQSEMAIDLKRYEYFQAVFLFNFG